jgi:hypothetical protein
VLRTAADTEADGRAGRAGRSLRRAFVSCALALVGGCTRGATAILLSVDTNAPVSTPFTLRARASRAADGGAMREASWRFRYGPAGPALPASFAVVPEPGRGEGPVWITLEATFEPPGQRPITIRRLARTGFVANVTVPLAILLNAACGASTAGCADRPASECTVSALCEERGLTCGDDGRCVAPTVLRDGGAPVDATVEPADGGTTTDATGADGTTLADAMDAMDAMNATDVMTDSASEAGDGPVCDSGAVACGDRCVDTARDRDHCGACGVRCPDGRACVEGRCACAPACAGRVCGDDGCGGSCGPCASPRVCAPDGTVCACPAGANPCGGACCAAGEACVSGRCCPSGWRTSVPGVQLQSIARDATGAIVLAGRAGSELALMDGDRAVVVTLDACGAVTGQQTLSPRGANRAGLSSVATRTSARTLSSPLAVAGSVQGATVDVDGVVMTLSSARLPATVTADTTVRFAGSSDYHHGAIQNADGSVWTAAAAQFLIQPACALATVTAAAGGTSCARTLFSPCTTDAAYAVGVGHDDRIWLVGNHGPQAFATPFDPSACAGSASCACAPARAPVEIRPSGTSFAGWRAVVAGPSRTFVAGFAGISSADIGALVGAIDGSGTVQLSALSNPTRLGDGYYGVAYGPSERGPLVYTSGLRNWNQSSPPSGSPGVLAAYDPVTLALRWELLVPGAGHCPAVAVDDAGGVLVVCTGPTGSTVRRCASSGTCPP